MIKAIKLPPQLIIDWARAVVMQAKTTKAMKKKPNDPKDWVERAYAIADGEFRNIAALWEAYTTERDLVGRYLSDPKAEALAYALGFHLGNAARLWGSLSRLDRSSGILKLISNPKNRLKLFDIGCGTGVMAHTFLSYLRFEQMLPKDVSVEAVDSRQAFLDFSTELYAESPARPETFNVVARKQRIDVWSERTSQNLSKIDPEQINVFFFGYVLNEMHRDKKALKQLKGILRSQHFRNGRTLIFIADSANEHICRFIMEVRDELREQYKVLYPCPHSEPCPMLALTNDWCYSEFTWDEPRQQTRISKKLGIMRQQLASSSFVFCSEALYQDIDNSREKHDIIVGRPLVQTRDSRDKVFTKLLCQPNVRLERSRPRADQPKEQSAFLRGTVDLLPKVTV